MFLLRGASAILGAAILGGCGYQGQPLPPALMMPMRVTDLTAVERGPNVVIRFTVPGVTVENLKVKHSDLELRIGPWRRSGDPQGELAEWQETSVRVADSQIPREGPVAEVVYPAAGFMGQTAYIAVSAHGPHGRTAGWSNFAILPIVPPLAEPEDVRADDAPNGVRLTWRAGAPEFRIFRRTEPDSAFDQIGTSARPEYTDETIEYGKTYVYRTQAIRKTDAAYAESEISAPVTIKPVDKFPPAAPAGLTPVPGTRTIELVWERNTEKDFAGYRVYRDGQKIAEGLQANTFSDRDVKPGVKYSYQVSAVDLNGLESPKTAAVETEIP